MEDKKKTIRKVVALCLLAGSIYPLYKIIRHQIAARNAESPHGTLGAETPSKPPSYDSSQYLFDGPVDGGLAASGRALKTLDPTSVSGSDSGGFTSKSASDTGAGAASTRPAAGHSAASGGKSAAASGNNKSASGSANAGGSMTEGAAGSGGTGQKQWRGSVLNGPIAGLPAEAFTGNMSQAQVDDLVSRFNKGAMSQAQIAALIDLVNSGIAFTEKQAQILRNIRAKDERKINDEMAKAASTPVELPPDMPNLGKGKVWPVKGRISQNFGGTNWTVYGGRTYNGVYYPHFHNGLDIAAPLGTPLHAYDAGQVTAVGGTQSSGVYVTIAHPGGLATSYWHMPVGGPTVRVGQYVSAGQVVGSIGMTGMTTGPHLHFMVRRGDVIDPLSVLPR
jgi:murein DD-endopeptidase MepM/ murein hydrolase activator NlpD